MESDGRPAWQGPLGSAQPGNAQHTIGGFVTPTQNGSTVQIEVQEGQQQTKREGCQCFQRALGFFSHCQLTVYLPVKTVGPKPDQSTLG